MRIGQSREQLGCILQPNEASVVPPLAAIVEKKKMVGIEGMELSFWDPHIMEGSNFCQNQTFHGELLTVRTGETLSSTRVNIKHTAS